MNDKSCHSCCDNPVLALCLVRLAVGLFFLLFGAMKLFMTGPDAVAGMMANLFGVEGSTASLLAWATILTEFVGGIILILGKMLPRILYKFTLLGFAIITVVGFISAHWMSNPTGFDTKQLLWHGMLLLVLFGLFTVAPKSPCGIVGDASCEMKSEEK